MTSHSGVESREYAKAVVSAFLDAPDQQPDEAATAIARAIAVIPDDLLAGVVPALSETGLKMLAEHQERAIAVVMLLAQSIANGITFAESAGDTEGVARSAFMGVFSGLSDIDTNPD